MAGASRDAGGEADVIVLGAGIVGVCAALHLQARGRSVTLVDRGEPGAETSHGNAGLIERASVIPYAMPRGVLALLGYATNRSTAVRYQLSALPRLLPWLARYWWYSGPSELQRIAREMLPLIEACVDEHQALIGPAGAGPLMREDGWIEIYPDPDALARAARQARALDGHGLRYDVLDPAALREREPHLANLAGALHWRDPMTSSDPGGVTRAYAGLFRERGGAVLRADALSLGRNGGRWTVGDGGARASAADAVIALGPWSSDLYDRLGYDFPMACKRGYCMHYSLEKGRGLTIPVCDSEAGFVLAPMQGGIRLTTGVELAERDAPDDARQVGQLEAAARRYFPLGAACDAKPWRGARPCLPDMKPIIGKAPRHDGLWFAFGHAHHGFTLGPVTGKLLAQMMTGERPLTDPSPFAAERFAPRPKP